MAPRLADRSLPALARVVPGVVLGEQFRPLSRAQPPRSARQARLLPRRSALVCLSGLASGVLDALGPTHGDTNRPRPAPAARGLSGLPRGSVYLARCARALRPAASARSRTL